MQLRHDFQTVWDHLLERRQAERNEDDARRQHDGTVKTKQRPTGPKSLIWPGMAERSLGLPWTCVCRREAYLAEASAGSFFFTQA